MTSGSRNLRLKEEAARLYTDGARTRDLAERYGRSPQTIIRWLHEMGATIRKRDASHLRGRIPKNARDWTEIDKIIREKYPAMGSALAPEIGISRHMLHCRASKLKIRTRRPPHTAAHKENISKALIGRYKGKVWRQRLSEALKGRPHSPERVQAIIAGVTASRRRPRRMTAPERKAQAVMEFTFGPYNPYVFTGDRGRWITFKNGRPKNPDFMAEDLKKVIEVFGVYWHAGEDPNELVSQYREVGWDCLVIWEGKHPFLRDDILYFTYPEEEDHELWEFMQTPL